MNIQNRLNKKGFTLIELLVVIAIIAILAIITPVELLLIIFSFFYNLNHFS